VALVGRPRERSCTIQYLGLKPLTNSLPTRLAVVDVCVLEGSAAHCRHEHTSTVTTDDGGRERRIGRHVRQLSWRRDAPLRAAPVAAHVIGIVR